MNILEPGLVVNSVAASYGRVAALWEASLHVRPGETVSLIGSNGAGKSTLLRSIMGIVRPTSGSVSFEGRPISGLRPHEVVARGISYVPEGKRLFPGISVEKNLRIGTPRTCEDLSERSRFVYGLFPVLEDKRLRPVATLSGGEQQMVAIGRALMAKPRMLLLDEPSMGLSPVAIQGLSEALAETKRRGVGVLLAEQNADLALQLSQRSYVLESGRIVMSGESADVLKDPAVKAAYVGVE